MPLAGGLSTNGQYAQFKSTVFVGSPISRLDLVVGGGRALRCLNGVIGHTSQLSRNVLDFSSVATFDGQSFKKGDTGQNLLFDPL